MTPAKNDKRSERYHYLRDLGFSSKDAKLWSHRKGERQIAEIDQRAEKFSAIRNRDRTYEQQQYLNKVRTTKAGRDQIIFSKSDRIDNWAKWSNKFGEGFPPDIIEEITDLNSRTGRDVFDKYGFRAYWFYYVENEDAAEAEALAAGYQEDE